MITFVQAARRSLADRPSRISCVSRLAAVSARSSVAASVTPAPSKSDGLTLALFGERPDLRRRAVDQHDADVQRPEQRHVEQQRREVVVGDDVAVDREDEVFSRNCGMYCRMPRRSVSFTCSARRGTSSDRGRKRNLARAVSCQVTKLSRFHGSTAKLANCQRSASSTAARPTSRTAAIGSRAASSPIGPTDRGPGTRPATSRISLIRQVVGHEDALVRVADHVDQPAQHRRRHLERRRVLAGHELARLVDVQLRAGPPAW